MIFSEIWNFIVETFEFIISEPLSALVIVLWIVFSVVMARSEDKSIFGMLIKNFFVLVILGILHAISPIVFWILIGSVVAISVCLAIVGG